MKSTRFFSFIQIFMVLTLVCSMMAPAVYSLMDVELSSIVIKDFAEEETQKKGENEKTEKNIFLYYLNHERPYAQYPLIVFFGIYSEKGSRFTSKIILPPPEFQV